MPKRDYKVIFTVSEKHTFHVPECNSPEEAESIAEQWFAEGEEGFVEDTDIESTETSEYTGEEE